MFEPLNILDEKDKHLRMKSVLVTSPLSKEEKNLIKRSIKQLTYSQIEKYEQQYNLRPGMGLAFPQLGINKRVIIIVHEYEEGKFDNYVVINPEMISHSEEIIAAEAGEGCLSVNREVEGHVPRYARVTIEAYDINGNKFEMRLREDLSICVQHEMDHLQGILFIDRIDKTNPFKDADKYRSI